MLKSLREEFKSVARCEQVITVLRYLQQAKKNAEHRFALILYKHKDHDIRREVLAKTVDQCEKSSAEYAFDLSIRDTLAYLTNGKFKISELHWANSEILLDLFLNEYLIKKINFNLNLEKMKFPVWSDYEQDKNVILFEMLNLSYLRAIIKEYLERMEGNINHHPTFLNYDRDMEGFIWDVQYQRDRLIREGRDQEYLDTYVRKNPEKMTEVLPHKAMGQELEWRLTILNTLHPMFLSRKEVEYQDFGLFATYLRMGSFRKDFRFRFSYEGYVVNQFFNKLGKYFGKVGKTNGHIFKNLIENEILEFRSGSVITISKLANNKEGTGKENEVEECMNMVFDLNEEDLYKMYRRVVEYKY